jgi:hypothetical protein
MNAFFTVYTSDGKEFESPAQELTDKEMGEFVDLLRAPKELSHFAMSVVDALGRTNKVFFNPLFIVAIKVTEVKI